MASAGGGGRVSWRARADVAAGAGRERLRAAGLSGDAPPADQARGGALSVLVAWALFVVAGAGALATLVGGAAVGGPAVLAGAVPALRAFARAGGAAAVRGRLPAAGILTPAAAVATVGLVAWAHTLTARRWAGHSPGYAAGFLGWGALVAACLAPWLLAGRPVGHPGPTLAPGSGSRSPAWRPPRCSAWPDPGGRCGAVRGSAAAHV